MRRVPSGMTLIELLVAVALLALVSVMAYRGLDGVSRANDRALAEAERWRAIALLFERFATDVSQPAHRPLRGAADRIRPEWWAQPGTDSAGTAAQLEFSRKSPPGHDDVRLGYRLRGTTVELLVWPVLDRASASLPEVYPLLDDVRALRFRYMDRDGIWRDRWPVTEAQPLPRAVSVGIALAEGLDVTRIFALP